MENLSSNVKCPAEASDPADNESLGAQSEATAETHSRVIIYHLKNAFIGTANIVGESEAGESSSRLNKNNLLVALVNDVFQNSKEEALYTLEQNVCEKLREATTTSAATFEDFAQLTFKQFLERNPSHFIMTAKENAIMVSKATKKQKKRKPRKDTGAADSHDPEKPWRTAFDDEQDAQAGDSGEATSSDPLSLSVLESDMGAWTEVTYKKTSMTTPSETSAGDSDASLRPVVRETTGAFSCSSIDEAYVESFLNKQQCDTIIFQESEDIYMNDRLEFTLDVVSLWNTPYQHKKYIVLGVRPQPKLPHVLVGLRSSTDEEVYQNMLEKSLFQLPPQFRYKEIVVINKRVGIFEIESSYGHGFPSIVCSNDKKPRLQKDQLWARKEGRNTLVAASDLVSGQIHGWFQSSTKTPERSETKPLPSTKNRSDKSCSTAENTAANSLTEGKATDQGQQLISALFSFEKGHFVLVCGSMRITGSNIEALATAPWIAVYDFDFRGRDSGLLAYLEDSIKKRRALSVSTWCDPHTGLTEKGTQWWSLRGQRAVAESVLSELSHVQWSMRVRDKLEKLCIELLRFCEDYTVLTILVLWPNSEVESKCVQKFIGKLQEHVQPRIILCFTDPDADCSDTVQVKRTIQSFAEDEDSVHVFHISLGEICSQVELVQSSHPPSAYQYQLRTVDSKSVTIKDEDAVWLAQDLEVLYLQSPYTKRAITAEQIRQEADHFFRGGTINWYVWYDVGPNCLDVERSICKDVIKHIRDGYLKQLKNGMVTIFHAPGSGGSTMAQRVLWELHEETPCVQVKLRTGSSMEDLAARLLFLHDRTHLPVVALIDGEDEPRLKQLSMHLQRHYIVILYVKRYPYPLPQCKATESKFYLPGAVDKRESRNLVHKFRESCDGEQSKIAALNKLDEDVQEDRTSHQMYEYGMTVFHHQFHGVRSYVRGYLQVDKNKGRELLPFQKCLGFLALVYYYGQSSLPCQFFAGLLGKPPTYILDLEDFPYHAQMFSVPDNNEGRRRYIRIGHYIIAKEILEQILNRGAVRNVSKGTNDRLSKDARRNLKDFCLEFISQSTKKKTKTSIAAHTICHVLTRTFIFRDNKDVCDIKTQTKRKTQFSQIMSDLDSDPPYNGRLEVLQALCNSFPDDANFRAHLGRFYTCCRPEEENQAEKHFEEALRLCEARNGGKEPNEIDDGSKLTRMHVYHMYGMFYQRRIAKYIGWNPDDIPSVSTDQINFQTRFDEIVQNATRACTCFGSCRQNTPTGQEDCYKYINEISVRLQTCEFVNRYFPGGVRAYLGLRASGPNFAFIKTSLTEIEDLIMECYYVILLDNVVLLQKYVHWYSSLFSSCSKELEALVKGDDISSLRIRLMAKKLQFRSDNMVSVEAPSFPPQEIESLVNILESIFQNENVYHDTPKSKLELDYKDWILAIRNPNLRGVYSLGKVLEHVRHWHDTVRSPQSTFYLFILLSLLGFGTRTSPGNTDSLVEAQLLLEDMQKLSKIVVRPRCPRELLGRDDFEGIRRLVSSNTVGHIDDRNIPSTARSKLAVCKGTIRAKNKKLAGYIDLDLGENTTPVKVFYVPVKAAGKLEGSRWEGERVQFHLAFTLEHGYEAYDVTLLERYRCSGCGVKVELTWSQEMAVCYKCSAKVTKNEHSRISATVAEDD